MRATDQLSGAPAGRVRRGLVAGQESARVPRQRQRRRLPHLYGDTRRREPRPVGRGLGELSAAHHRHTPVWSPSGRFIALVAEKRAYPGNSVGATPGWGGYSDLWVATADGSRAWQLTDVPTDKDHGTIIPEFSPDGRLLEWTERIKAGEALQPQRFAGFWAIKVANFDVSADGTPSLANAHTFSPGDDAFNETGGFSADPPRWCSPATSRLTTSGAARSIASTSIPTRSPGLPAAKATSNIPATPQTVRCCG